MRKKLTLKRHFESKRLDFNETLSWIKDASTLYPQRNIFQSSESENGVEMNFSISRLIAMPFVNGECTRTLLQKPLISVAGQHKWQFKRESLIQIAEKWKYLLSLEELKDIHRKISYICSSRQIKFGNSTSRNTLRIVSATWIKTRIYYAIYPTNQRTGSCKTRLHSGWQ